MDVVDTMSLSYEPSHPLYDWQEKQQMMQKDAMRVQLKESRRWQHSHQVESMTIAP
jgi:hypothetical protein